MACSYRMVRFQNELSLKEPACPSKKRSGWSHPSPPLTFLQAHVRSIVAESDSAMDPVGDPVGRRFSALIAFMTVRP